MELISKTIGECLKERVHLSGRCTAIEMGGFHCTFEQLDRFSDFAAARMEEDGVGKGTHAGIWCANGPDWVLAFLALAKIGAVPVLINTCFRDAEVTRVLNYADVEVLYYGAGNESLIERIRRKTARVKKFIPIGEKGAGTWAGSLVGTAPPPPADLKRVEGKKKAVRPEDPACMIFTSGTTSFSKGVLLSHYSLVNNSRAMVEAMHWKEDDKMCLTVPLFHCFGITAGILACLLSGAEMDLLPCFKTAYVWDALERGRCTILNGVPSMFLALIRKSEHCGRRADTLRSGIIAGSPVTPEEYAEICRRFPQMHLQPSYGQTETSPCVTIAGWDDPGEKKGASAGRLIDHVSARIADLKTGGVLGRDLDGEIQVKGYNVMLGYYRLPEVTAGAFTEDGWLRTGDIGNFDGSGELHVTGRLKEMIIRGGENISPREIERVIKRLKWVDQVKVVGVPADVLQEEIAACIIPRQGCGINKDELVDFLKPRLARYKMPAYILEFDGFPVNASGKIDLKGLKSKAAAMAGEEKRVRKDGGCAKMKF
ncbi:AMP-binding protein [Caproiciproducens sp. NJN-50]|uniref:class I adenylate-forming enzyme family protein n=1 Tax=Acutalibacteraceae TaxID=3082771 RepID=UPI000FFE139D|nr:MULTISPECIES: class I adenylate-forming enzyme family protein [Acutalibacteraceae]QAT48651.1 AMP-binding protein [Caproiciproducens sp. NJN-50]